MSSVRLLSELEGSNFPSRFFEGCCMLYVSLLLFGEQTRTARGKTTEVSALRSPEASYKIHQNEEINALYDKGVQYHYLPS